MKNTKVLNVKTYRQIMYHVTALISEHYVELISDHFLVEKMAILFYHCAPAKLTRSL